MTDIELLPLPEGTEAGEYMMGALLFDHSDMTSYADANVAHHTAAKGDEIEGLKRLVRHLAGNPDFDFEAALAAQPGGSDNDR